MSINVQPVFDTIGLAMIRRAMNRRKRIVDTYLSDFETSKIWNNFREGFLSHNNQTNLRYMVDMAACDLTDTQESFFLPTNKKSQIVICYNKVKDREHFDKLLTYNLVFAYDNAINKQANWNDHKFVTATTVKLFSHIDSRLESIEDLYVGYINFNPANKLCFKKEVDERVNSAERFRNRPDIFDEVYEQVIHDVRPINEMKFA